MRAAVPREVNTELREGDPKQESPRHPHLRQGGEGMDGPDVQRQTHPKGILKGVTSEQDLGSK